MSRVTRGTPGGEAYLDLQNQARRSGRLTQELLLLYVLEGFLARLAASEVRERLALKGGVLLASFGSRRPTKDVDLAALDVANDLETVLDIVRTVLVAQPGWEDGIEFRSDTVTGEIIREDDDYSGVRVHVEASLASAKLPFHVDVNIGDPIWPAPARVSVPRLRGGEPIELLGYPIHMILAEKLVTAVQRGIANTRWRDFGDVWTLTGQHPISADDVAQAAGQVARYREATLRPLAEVLDGFAELAQPRWVQWRRRSNSDHLPESFAVVLERVVGFTDPVVAGLAVGQEWQPATARWA